MQAVIERAFVSTSNGSTSLVDWEEDNANSRWEGVCVYRGVELSYQTHSTTSTADISWDPVRISILMFIGHSHYRIPSCSNHNGRCQWFFEIQSPSDREYRTKCS